MRRLLFVLVVPALGFVAPTSSVVGRVGVSCRRRRPAAPTMVAVPVMFKDFGKAVYSLLVPPPPSAQTAKIEGAEYFRFLGISPDAGYKEVQEAVAAMKEKYANDKKMLVKIDVNKDKISDLRLRQRVRGTLAISAEVAFVEKEKAERAEKQKQKLKIKNKPKWMKLMGQMWLPPWKISSLKNYNDRQWAADHIKRAGWYYFACLFVVVFFPKFCNGFRLIAPILFVSHLAQRGRPPPVKTDDGMWGEVREANYQAYFYALFFIVTHGLAGLIIGDIVAHLGIVGYFTPRQIRFAFYTAGYYVADILWQPHIVTDKNRNK